MIACKRAFGTLTSDIWNIHLQRGLPHLDARCRVASPAPPPNSHEPNPTNRRCLPCRDPQRRLVRAFARPGASTNFAGTRHHATPSRGAFHFGAASAFAPLE